MNKTICVLYIIQIRTGRIGKKKNWIPGLNYARVLLPNAINVFQRKCRIFSSTFRTRRDKQKRNVPLAGHIKMPARFGRQRSPVRKSKQYNKFGHNLRSPHAHKHGRFFFISFLFFSPIRTRTTAEISIFPEYVITSGRPYTVVIFIFSIL